MYMPAASGAIAGTLHLVLQYFGIDHATRRDLRLIFIRNILEVQEAGSLAMNILGVLHDMIHAYVKSCHPMALGRL